MKVVFTGDTVRPREALTRSATQAGLDVMNSVSSRTSVLVCNNAAEMTGKADGARLHGTTVVNEDEFITLLASIERGEPKTTDASPQVAGRQRTAASRTVPRSQITRGGPLAQHRVLVLGGAHDRAADTRAHIIELGGQAAANLTASVTDLVALDGHEFDSRWARVQSLGLRQLDPSTLQPQASSTPARTDVEAHQPLPAEGEPREGVEPAPPVVLARGGVLDLPSQTTTWELAVSWQDASRSTGDARLEVDVVAFVVDPSEEVGGDEDFCFYNQPTHPSGAVTLELDVPNEALVKLATDLLPASQKVIVAAAIDGDATFGDLGPIELTLRTTLGQVIVRATLDAGARERTMLLATFYPRNDAWRFRPIGQGYREGLAHLAVLHGIDLED
jgi:DNA polymerase-3 subunit epsilon